MLNRLEVKLCDIISQRCLPACYLFCGMMDSESFTRLVYSTYQMETRTGDSESPYMDIFLFGGLLRHGPSHVRLPPSSHSLLTTLVKCPRLLRIDFCACSAQPSTWHCASFDVDDTFMCKMDTIHLGHHVFCGLYLSQACVQPSSLCVGRRGFHHDATEELARISCGTNQLSPSRLRPD
jgi:hypothetical protein